MSLIGKQNLFAQAKLFNQRAITNRIGTLQVSQQAFTTIDHHNQATTRVMILSVGLEMTVEVIDTSG